ncbi:hypothetical protein Gogos_021173, partial [Gossypium gossypioides]|nr:hypothetical protein [Gossypium gossypioides]
APANSPVSAFEVEVEGYETLERGGGNFDWAGRLYMTTNPILRRKPYLFSELPSSLRNSMETYILELQKFGEKLLSLMAKALKLDEKEMMEYFED